MPPQDPNKQIPGSEDTLMEAQLMVQQETNQLLETIVEQNRQSNPEVILEGAVMAIQQLSEQVKNIPAPNQEVILRKIDETNTLLVQLLEESKKKENFDFEISPELRESLKTKPEEVVPFVLAQIPKPEDGKDGATPEKGRDYYTQEEKDQLVKEILAQIPEKATTKIIREKIVERIKEPQVVQEITKEVILTITGDKIVELINTLPNDKKLEIGAIRGLPEALSRIRGGGTGYLREITDVKIENPVEGQTIIRRGEKWVNENLPESASEYSASFSVSDWSVSGDYYILDVVHSLNSNNPSVTVRRSNGIIQVDSTENVDANTIRLRVPSTPDLRFDGVVSVIGVS